MAVAAKVGMGMANAGAAVENAVKDGVNDGAISAAKGVDTMAAKAGGGVNGCLTRPSCNCSC